MSRYKSERSRATDFSLEVKKQMMERDNYRCIFCSDLNITPAHYISRGAGGLGILENGVCLCVKCHQALDFGITKDYLRVKVQRHLKRHHPDFKDEDRIFNRRTWLRGD